MHVLYLHGFASSPLSSKARFFAERFAQRGIGLRVPDFNEPDFADLTVTRMVEQVRRELVPLPPGQVALIGSSLGAFVALQAAAHQRQPEGVAPEWLAATHPIKRLVLLAPALDFTGNRTRNLGEAGLARWRDTDRLEVFHYGYREARPIRFRIYADAATYRPFDLQLDLPILIFQGKRDVAVDPSATARFAAARPQVTLRWLDDDHQLLSSLDEIWSETAAFLGLAP
jgi:pimeloyl-ACP methyl ester carboxylesterase